MTLWRYNRRETGQAAYRSLTVCSSASFVPHPFAFFLAKGWETTNPKYLIERSQSYRHGARKALLRISLPASSALGSLLLSFPRHG